MANSTLPGDQASVSGNHSSTLWHTLKPQQAITLLESGPEGLSPSEVERRLQVYGPNELQEAAGRSALEILWDQFKNIMLLMLIAVAMVSLVLDLRQGHPKDAITLAQRLWLNGSAMTSQPPGLIQAHQVHSAMLALVQDMAVTFEALLLLLPPTQARVLESLALDPTHSPQSNAYIKKHQLSRGGGLQGALTSLEQKGLIYGPHLHYRIALPLLDFWLKQRLQ